MRTRSLLQPRVGAVLGLVDPALSGQEASVHDFRVAARSLRAALLTVARQRRSALVSRARAALQSATRGLAVPRDRDVGRSLLLKRTSGFPLGGDFRRRVAGLSESHRRLALARCAAAWPRKLDRLLVKLLQQGEASVDTVIRRARAGAWQQRRRALTLLTSLGRRYDPVRLHDLRRRVRSLRYAMEVLAEVDSTASARVTRLKPLQSALGDIQDRIVLSRWLAAQSGRFRRSEPAFAAALKRESTRYRKQSMAAHAAFLRGRPAVILEGLALHVDPHTQAPQSKQSGVRTRSVRV